MLEKSSPILVYDKVVRNYNFVSRSSVRRFGRHKRQAVIPKITVVQREEVIRES